MKITAAESFVVRYEVPRAVTDAVNQATHVCFAGVIITTDDGLQGTGFTTTLGAGELAIKEVIDRHYAPLLIDADPLCHQRIWEQLYWSAAHWAGRAGVTQMALAAVDIALWDIKAKAAGLPLWKLVGGHKDGAVDSYNTDGGWLNFELPRMIDEMMAMVEAGWPAVKMKIGRPNPREDLARVTAVREALGPDVDLMVDVNQGWDLTTAVTWAPRYDELHLRWLEEPLDPDDVSGHARLAAATKTPIALGEHVYSRTAFRDFIERGGIGYVQADVTRLGGITEWLAVAEMAQAHHLPVVPHCGDLMRVAPHLGVGHPSCPLVECIPWAQELFADELEIRPGRLRPSDTPGASTTFDPAAFAALRVA
jgi:L-alanine-DL-glutamate epimerase-like enolase superfamily enzyme